MTILELVNPLEVHTIHGKGKVLFLYDYGIDVNTVFGVRLHDTGQYKHYISEQIVIYPNPMSEEPKLNIPVDWKQ